MEKQRAADKVEDPESSAPEPNEELSVVFTTNDDSEALVVKGLLESNGYDVMMSTPEAPVGVFPISSSDLGRVRLLIRAELEPEARRMIEDYSRGGPENAEEAERQTES